MLSSATIIGSYRSSAAITKQSARFGVIAKMESRVKCGFRRAGCEVVPMCKVPGNVRGRAVLFAVAELLVLLLLLQLV